MKIELGLPEETILDEISRKVFTRLMVAQTYAMLVTHSDHKKFDWAKINAAIIERWSMYALHFIKTEAWRLLKERTIRMSQQNQN